MVVRILPHPQQIPGIVADHDLGLRLKETVAHAADLLGTGDGESGSGIHTHANPWGVKFYCTTELGASPGPHLVFRQLHLAFAPSCELRLYVGMPTSGPMTPSKWRVKATPLFGTADVPDGVWSVPARGDMRDPYNHRLTLPTPGLWVLDLYVEAFNAVDSLHVVPESAGGTSGLMHATDLVPTTADPPVDDAFPALGGVYNGAWMRLARVLKATQCAVYDPDSEGTGRHEHGDATLPNPTVLFASTHGIPFAIANGINETAQVTVGTTPETVVDTDVLEGTNAAGATYLWLGLVWVDPSKAGNAVVTVNSDAQTTTAAGAIGGDWYLVTGSFTATAAPAMTAVTATQEADDPAGEVALGSLLIIREVP